MMAEKLGEGVDKTEMNSHKELLHRIIVPPQDLLFMCEREREREVNFNMIQFAINSCFTFNVHERSIVFGIVLQNSNDVVSSFTKE